MQLIEALFDLCKSENRPIIAIDGPAGAGKTTLAGHISAAMALRYKCTTLHMDDLYNGWATPFDHHLSDALSAACNAHKKSSRFSLSTYDWGRAEFRAAQGVPSCDLLILEGVGSSQPSIREFLTASIWIEIDPAIGFERVLQRDGEIIASEMKDWLELQNEFFSANDSMRAADFVLTNELK